MRKLLVAVFAVVVLVGLAAPVVAARQWRTKAHVIAKGASYVDTDAWVETVIERPYALRIGYATPAGSKKFKVYYSVFCDNASASRTIEITTPKDGSPNWVTPISPGNLGPYCEVSTWTRTFKGTDKLVLKVQAKHR